MRIEKNPEIPRCPHCFHCQTPFKPSLPSLPFKTLLQPCGPAIQFIYCINWLKSLSTVEENLPVCDMKTVLESILEIEKNELIESSKVISKMRNDKKVNAVKQKELNPRKRKIESDSRIITRAMKRERKMEMTDNDSAVDLQNSPEWHPESFTSNYQRKSRLIPDSDHEASDCTPDISFGEYSGELDILDSGVGCLDESNTFHSNVIDNSQDIPANRQNDQENNEKRKSDTISSRKMSYIFNEFEITVTALKIVKKTLTVLEQEDSIIYCFKETDTVIELIKTIVGFLDVVAVEERNCPGYFDFFIKAIVQTIKNCVISLKRDDLSVERTHHLITLLQFCNYRLICEEIISYLLEELINLTDPKTMKFDFDTRMEKDFKHFALMDGIHVTMEKYYNIMKCAQYSPDLNQQDKTSQLLDKWKKHVRHYSKQNINDEPSKVNFLKTIFYNLRISIEGDG